MLRDQAQRYLTFFEAIRGRYQTAVLGVYSVYLGVCHRSQSPCANIHCKLYLFVFFFGTGEMSTLHQKVNIWFGTERIWFEIEQRPRL